MAVPHNDNQLGKPLRSKKKRGAVFIVIAISVGVHVLGLGIFGIIKIVETIAPKPEFEAPPVEIVDQPPPPPPPPPTTKRTQKSMPRPQPLVAQNPQNLDVPMIEMQDSNLAIGGRGVGGGFGELGGGMLDRVDISFFGIEGGNNVVVLFDRTGSGQNIFNRTRAELMKTIDAMKSNPSSRLAVLYFGGREGGHQGISKGGSDPTKHDYWWPKGIRSNTWLRPERGEAESLVSELNKIPDPKGKGNSYASKDPRDIDRGKAYFVLGTNFWGALESAYRLDPVPDTVYIMVEPGVAFTNSAIVKSAFASWEKYGVDKPQETTVYFVVGKPKNQVKDKAALNLMVNLVHGGGLSQKEIDKLIIY
ncbi:MAG: hypothetical protein NWT02_00335 [Opitutales bacterium]|nr:hypothetical protein [Opitutales bacterium]MDP4644534.1 hypothetical protein [Opitutales bacterium]MDP4878676.1 hypothetical protein [Opitutales bacterium]